MQLERVQRWVLSSLLLTVTVLFASGIVISAVVSDPGGSRAGLLVIAGVVGLAAMAGVRAINEKSIATPWLLAGLVPAAVGWYFVFVR
jgi:multisubunit Na+/H+ antiporter MnhB subunit